MSSAVLREAHRTYLEETLFEAVISAAAIVALADGEVDEAERTELVGLVERSGWLSTYTATEAVDAFDSQIRQLQLAGTPPEALLNSVRRIGDTHGACVVLWGAQSVASADGRVEKPEETALALIRSAVALHATARPSW